MCAENRNESIMIIMINLVYIQLSQTSQELDQQLADLEALEAQVGSPSQWYPGCYGGIALQIL